MIAYPNGQGRPTGRRRGGRGRFYAFGFTAFGRAVEADSDPHLLDRIDAGFAPRGELALEDRTGAVALAALSGQRAHYSRPVDAERIRIDVADHVADVRMMRADKRNEFDWRMFGALNEAIDSLRADPTCGRSCSPAKARIPRGPRPGELRGRRPGLDETGFEIAVRRSRTSTSGSPTAGASSTCR